MDSNRKKMFDALTRVYIKCEELDIRPRTDALYTLAGQLTIADSGIRHRGMVDGNYSDAIRKIFADHFVFLCEHTIDCLNTSPKEKECNGCGH